MSLMDHTIYRVETIIVGGCSCALRDELLACQHPTESVGESVHMDGNYVFDSSLEHSITSYTKRLCMELVDSYPNAQMFIFNP